jgi:hypothetical protein
MMHDLTIVAAFLAGFAGGVHCAAMCGPLVGIASGTLRESAGRSRWIAHALAYNAGRIATYTIAGVLVGTLGAGGLALRGGPLMQHIMLAVMGLALIVIAASVAGVVPLARAIEGAGALAWRRIQPYSRWFLPADTPVRAFGLGLVWGWLPCGLVYVALIAALATADPVRGALMMAAFGAGTLPNLLALTVWFRSVPRLVRWRPARALVAVVIAGVGVMGIAAALGGGH